MPFDCPGDTRRKVSIVIVLSGPTGIGGCESQAILVGP